MLGWSKGGPLGCFWPLDSWLPPGQCYSAASESTPDLALNWDWDSAANSQTWIAMIIILIVVPCRSGPSGNKAGRQGTKACQGGKMK